MAKNKTIKNAAKRLILLVVICSVGVLGTYLLLHTRAATSYTPVDPRTDLFKADSFWYQRVDSVNQLNADSTNMVQSLIDAYTTPSGGGGVYYNTNNYSRPLYTARADDPRYNIGFYNCQGKPGVPDWFPSTLSGVPIPENALPGAGSDGSMAIYLPATNQLWEMWKVRKDSSGNWTACHGGRIDNVSQTQGVFPRPTGVSASGLAMWGGVIRLSELRAGKINHAITFAMPYVGWHDYYSYPANRSDGGSFEPHRIYEGQRLRLDPNINVEALPMSREGKIVAKAIQEYGMILVDKAGAVTLHGESTIPYTQAGLPNPYTGLFGGKQPSKYMEGMPWDKLQALPFDWGKPGNVQSFAPPGTAIINIVGNSSPPPAPAPTPGPASPPAPQPGTQRPANSPAAASPATSVPTFSNIAPASNSELKDQVLVGVTVKDSAGVAKVELYIDDKNVGTDVVEPYVFAWKTSTFKNGKHSFYFKAYNSAGRSSTSPVTTVTTNNKTSGAAASAVTTTASSQLNSPSAPIPTGSVFVDEAQLYNVSIVVLDGSSKPVVNASVQLGNKINKTGKLGEAIFSGIGKGTYKARVKIGNVNRLVSVAVPAKATVENHNTAEYVVKLASYHTNRTYTGAIAVASILILLNVGLYLKIRNPGLATESIVEQTVPEITAAKENTTLPHPGHVIMPDSKKDE